MFIFALSYIGNLRTINRNCDIEALCRLKLLILCETALKTVEMCSYNVTHWVSVFIHQLIDVLKSKCSSIHALVMKHSIAIMSACNPEIMEDILDTDDNTR